MRYLLLLLVLLFSGCERDFQIPSKKTVEQQLESIEIVVPEGQSRLDALIEERSKNKGVIELTKQKLNDLEGKEKSLNAQIKQAEIDRQQFYLNLISGISIFLFLLCGAIAIITFITNPIISKISKWLAGIFLCVSALSIMTSIIIPYMAWIGLGIVVLGVISTIIGLVAWRNNSTALKEVVGAVQETKSLIPDYRTKFKKFIGTNSNKIIDNIRSHL
jgi:hypothetical protein